MLRGAVEQHATHALIISVLVTSWPSLVWPPGGVLLSAQQQPARASKKDRSHDRQGRRGRLRALAALL